MTTCIINRKVDANRRSHLLDMNNFMTGLGSLVNTLDALVDQSKQTAIHDPYCLWSIWFNACPDRDDYLCKFNSFNIYRKISAKSYTIEIEHSATQVSNLHDDFVREPIEYNLSIKSIRNIESFLSNMTAIPFESTVTYTDKNNLTYKTLTFQDYLASIVKTPFSTTYCHINTYTKATDKYLQTRDCFKHMCQDVTMFYINPNGDQKIVHCG